MQIVEAICTDKNARRPPHRFGVTAPCFGRCADPLRLSERGGEHQTAERSSGEDRQHHKSECAHGLSPVLRLRIQFAFAT
jgi:hypothetical protein